MCIFCRYFESAYGKDIGILLDPSRLSEREAFELGGISKQEARKKTSARKRDRQLAAAAYTFVARTLAARDALATLGADLEAVLPLVPVQESNGKQMVSLVDLYEALSALRSALGDPPSRTGATCSPAVTIRAHDHDAHNSQPPHQDPRERRARSKPQDGTFGV